MDLARTLPGVVGLTLAGGSAWCAKEWEAFSRRTHGLGAASRTVLGGRNAGLLANALSGYQAAELALQQALLIHEELAAQLRYFPPTSARTDRDWPRAPKMPRTLPLPDHRTPLERKIGADLDNLGPPPTLEALCHTYTSRPVKIKCPPGAMVLLYGNRSGAPTRPLATILSAIRQLVRNINRLAKTVARLRSLCDVIEPQPTEPPGQLVTAQPHVTRGPTSLRAAMVLSAPWRLQLA